MWGFAFVADVAGLRRPDRANRRAADGVAYYRDFEPPRINDLFNGHRANTEIQED